MDEERQNNLTWPHPGGDGRTRRRRELCGQLRQELIRDVARTGGHLASNLGAVELTVAIHRVFDTSRDRLVFDVGHQCYPHKMLTGRREQMSTIAAARRDRRLPQAI